MIVRKIVPLKFLLVLAENPIICQLATGVRGDHQNESRTSSGAQFLYCLTCLIAVFGEAEHARVSESVFECPPLLQSPFFLPLILKLLLVDLLLTILLIIVVLVHRTYIIPARRRQRIRRGLARAHKRRTMRERARRRLARLRHPTEQSSSEGGDELVTAAAGRGGRTTTKSEKRGAYGGENGGSPAGQPLDANASGAVGMA
ncbi:unnamed protein product [Toxocara canis]|uniref:Transmembrane protein n=1 Tax=Toxocara canis TaxID=6265 RepID=A0A183VCT1_TOXCA|nr:unnamed protein product [Toxocara canis]